MACSHRFFSFIPLKKKKWLRAVNSARYSRRPWNWLLLHRSHVLVQSHGFLYLFVPTGVSPAVHETHQLCFLWLCGFSRAVTSRCFSTVHPRRPCCTVVGGGVGCDSNRRPLRPKRPLWDFFMCSHVPLDERNLHLDARTAGGLEEERRPCSSTFFEFTSWFKTRVCFGSSVFSRSVSPLTQPWVFLKSRDITLEQFCLLSPKVPQCYSGCSKVESTFCWRVSGSSVNKTLHPV